MEFMEYDTACIILLAMLTVGDGRPSFHLNDLWLICQKMDYHHTAPLYTNIIELEYILHWIRWMSSPLTSPAPFTVTFHGKSFAWIN